MAAGLVIPVGRGTASGMAATKRPISTVAIRPRSVMAAFTRPCKATVTGKGISRAGRCSAPAAASSSSGVRPSPTSSTPEGGSGRAELGR